MAEEDETLIGSVTQLVTDDELILPLGDCWGTESPVGE